MENKINIEKTEKTKEFFNELIVKYLVEIADGKCSITDEVIQAQEDTYFREILMGLLLLHEDLDYRFNMQEKMTLAYKQSQKEFQTLYEQLPLPVLMIATDYVILKANNSFFKEFNYVEDKFREKDLFSIFIDDQEIEKVLKNFESLRFFRSDNFTIEVKLKSNINEIYWCYLTGSYVHDDISNNFYFIVSLQNITSIKHLTEELERSNKELEQFAFFASHDLQQPLRLITSYLQLIERNNIEVLDETSIQWFNTVKSASKRMKALITDLLKYSRFHLDRDRLVNFDLNNALHQAKINLQQLILDSNSIITQEDLPEIKGEKRQFIQLFQNLLENSIKYRSKEPPKIHISYSFRNMFHQFTITDNGIGIELKNHNVVFQLFQRLDKSIEGTGMGLSICNKIVEEYKGKIWIESDLNKGTTIIFTISPLNSN